MICLIYSAGAENHSDRFLRIHLAGRSRWRVCPSRSRLDRTVSAVSHRGQPVLRRQQGAGKLFGHDAAGNILINSDLEANVPLIQASIEKLGFKFTDTKILLISHAHFDHDAGSAKIKEMTGAKYMVMDADVPVVESGGKLDFQYGDRPEFLYRPTKVDRVLHDGEEVRLGGTVLVAHLTPGHTKGCTTWRMQVTEGGKTYNAVIVGSPNVNPGYKLVNNQNYPQIADDYVRMWAVLKSLPCDIFLGAHGAYFGLEEKYARLKDGGANPFVDPSGYKKYVAEKEQEFDAELAKQRLTGK